MRRPPRTSALAALALACACAAAAEPAPPAAPATPVQWLERMNRALTTRNYDGTFTHWQGGRVEMLRIVHRIRDGAVSERLASLDGSGREFIRTGTSLACYLPDQRTVLVEQRPAQQSLVGFPTFDAQTAAYYDIREIGRTRVNRHDTHVIEVAPRDAYRYGYRLWIDDATAMPVKTQLCDLGGRVIEQIVFANLTLPAHIPDADFRPEVATDGFQWVRNDPAMPPPSVRPAWNAMQLPPGFRMAVRAAQTLPGASGPVEQLVFTDGFASVSVFVERTEGVAGAPAAPQAAALGSSSAFSTVVDGHKVTAVGEVPPATVRFLATQVRAVESAAAAPAH